MRLSYRAIAAVSFVLYILVLLWVNQEKICLSDHQLYWVQVVSGNWSPDFTTKTSYPIHRFSFLLGSVIAVILNFLTIAGILAAAYGLLFITGQKMKYRTLLDIRDDLILQKLLQVFPEDNRLALKDVFKKQIEEANSEWDDTISVVVPDHTKREFFKTIDKSFEPE